MTDVNDIPYADIVLFLTTNNVRLSSKQKNYNTAFEMIKRDKNYIYPDSIIDWIIAYNFDGNINKYSKREIDSLNKEQLNDLAGQLGIFDSNDIKTSIINVLGYLRKLSGIINPDIDSYIENMLEKLDEQKLLNSNYDEAVELFQKNKRLRLFFYDNMREIIKRNLLNKDNIYLIESEITNFIIDLLKINETILAKEVLKIVGHLSSINFVTLREFTLLIFNRILRTSDVQLIENYLKLLPYIGELFAHNKETDIISYFGIFVDGLTKRYLGEYFIPFLTAAINAEKFGLAAAIIDIWDEKKYLLNSSDQEIINKMNILIKKAEKLI